MAIKQEARAPRRIQAAPRTQRASLALGLLAVLAPTWCPAAPAPTAPSQTAPVSPVSPVSPWSLDAFRTPSREVNTITMRASARISPNASVLLGDIAILQGALAQSLANVVIVGAGDVAIASPLEISISRVRSSLASHDSTLEGRVLVNGSITRVWVASQVPTPAPVAAAAPSAPVTIPDAGPTVRTAIVDKIAGVLGVSSDQLVARFEPQDAEFLATSTLGRIVAVSPTGTGERIGVMVKVYDRDRVIASQSLRVGVAIRRTCAVLVTNLDRGESVREGAFKLEEREVAPNLIIADPATLLGRTTKARLAPGRVLEARDVESPVVVSRGDVVTVECLSGGILLKTYGRARGSGREGDIVSFEPLRKGRTFEARIAGPGRAVALVEGNEGLAAPGTGLASEPLPQRAQPAPAADSAIDPGNGFFIALP